MALRLFGVTALDGEPPGSPVHGTFTVSFRDLDAVVAEVEFESLPSTPEDIALHHEVVESLFQRFPIVPAPYGTVLGSMTVVQRWLEVHYFSLSDALRYVEDKAAARVYVSERESVLGDLKVGEPADILKVTSDAFRALRRQAVASSTLRASEEGGPRVAGTFLIERDRWTAFTEVVAEEGRRYPTLQFRLSGPWPPYDFVKLQLGG